MHHIVLGSPLDVVKGRPCHFTKRVCVTIHTFPCHSALFFFCNNGIQPRFVSKENMPSQTKRTKSVAKKSTSKNRNDTSSSVSFVQYPGHVGRGFGYGLYSVGKGFYDGLDQFVGGFKTGGSRVKGGVVQGTLNMKNKRVIRGPLRMVEGVGMGVANVASGTFSGLKTTADGFVEGGRSVVRGVSASPHVHMKKEVAKKKMVKSPTKTSSPKKLTSSTRKSRSPRQTKK